MNALDDFLAFVRYHRRRRISKRCKACSLKRAWGIIIHLRYFEILRFAQNDKSGEARSIESLASLRVILRVILRSVATKNLFSIPTFRQILPLRIYTLY